MKSITSVRPSAAVKNLADDDVPSFPDEDAGEPEDGEDERGEETTDEDNEDTGEQKMAKLGTKKETKTSAKKAAAVKDNKPEKKTASAKNTNGGGEKTMSMSKRLRTLIIKKPSLGVEALMAKLESEGYKATKMTVGTFRSDTRATLKALVEAKMLDIEL